MKARVIRAGAMLLHPVVHPRALAQIIGVWLLLYAGALVPPILVSIWYQDGELVNFSMVLLGMVLCGGALRLLGGRERMSLRLRDGFIVVVLIWLLSSALGSILFITNLHLSPTDAFFESVSALTTTGATVITGLDHLPQAILFFRQEMQWLGGIGVVVAAIALMPLLGVGGMQLFRAEAPGPVKDEKLAPRIAHTASILLRIYLGLTAACALGYWFAGMSFFDALAHSFTTVSTGGFSTHDDSIGYFDNRRIEWVAVTFMLLGSINFSVHFAAWRGLNINRYRENEEARTFLLIVLFVTLLVSVSIYLQGDHGSLVHSFRVGIFTVSSVITSTGFGIDNFSLWGGALPYLMMLISFIGGCGGSTAGGVKVVRVLLLFKIIRLEFLRLIHPGIVRPIRLQGAIVDWRIVDGIKVFVTFYILIFMVLMVLLIELGMNLETAFSAVATSINNLGPGLRELASNFQTVPDSAKWVLAMAMLLGRLEIFSLFVLFSPKFWKN